MSRSEGCPLGSGLYWENLNEIPEFCQKNCNEFIDTVGEIGGPVIEQDYDYFPDDGSGEHCRHEDHDLETEDVSLQRGQGTTRILGVTDQCSNCGMEYGAQSYKFNCSN